MEDALTAEARIEFFLTSTTQSVKQPGSGLQALGKACASKHPVTRSNLSSRSRHEASDSRPLLGPHHLQHTYPERLPNVA